MKIYFLIKPDALWIGVHYSRFNRRWCINLIPCATICIVKKGGKPPCTRFESNGIGYLVYFFFFIFVALILATKGGI